MGCKMEDVKKVQYTFRISRALLDYCKKWADKLDMTVTEFVIHSIVVGAPILIERLTGSADGITIGVTDDDISH